MKALCWVDKLVDARVVALAVLKVGEKADETAGLLESLLGMQKDT